MKIKSRLSISLSHDSTEVIVIVDKKKYIWKIKDLVMEKLNGLSEHN